MELSVDLCVCYFVLGWLFIQYGFLYVGWSCTITFLTFSCVFLLRHNFRDWISGPTMVDCWWLCGQQVIRLPRLPIRVYIYIFTRHTFRTNNTFERTLYLNFFLATTAVLAVSSFVDIHLVFTFSCKNAQQHFGTVTFIWRLAPWVIIYLSSRPPEEGFSQLEWLEVRSFWLRAVCSLCAASCRNGERTAPHAHQRWTGAALQPHEHHTTGEKA